jgi:phosphatidylglycerophosphate synthase
VIDNAFRRILPRFVGPLIALYGRLGMTPNHVTWLGLAIALVASVAVAAGLPGWALGLWWLSRLADGTDGIYARATGQESEFGGYLDIVLDMAAYGAMVIGFAIAEPSLQAHWMAMLFLYVLCIASALALGMQEAKIALPPRDDRGLRLGAGLAEGGETGIAYSVFLLWPSLLPYTATAWVAILFTTVVARSRLARRTLRADDRGSSNSAIDGSRSTRPTHSPRGL